MSENNMSRNFRKLQIESLKKSVKSEKLIENVGKTYENNDSLEFRKKEEMQKKLLLILEGMAIEAVADLSTDFMIYGADNNKNLSSETREFIKLSKEISSLMTKLSCKRDNTKESQETVKELKINLDESDMEMQAWLESEDMNSFIFGAAKEERECEKLLLEKLGEFAIFADKLGISANKIISLLEEYFLID